MSGAPNSRSGNQGQHLKAAQNWLARADAQFKTGREVVAAGTIMLAQAELKLLVEGVVSKPVTAKAASRGRPSRIFPIPRVVTGVAALAACLAMGFFLGTAINPGTPDGPSGEPPIAIASLPDTPSSSSETEAVPDEIPVDTEVMEEAVVDNVVMEEPAEVEEQPARPVYRPQPTRQPEVTEAPVVSEPPDKPAPSEAEETVPEDEPAAEEVSPPDDVISPAEVALRTIRAISERLNNGENE